MIQSASRVYQPTVLAFAHADSRISPFVQWRLRALSAGRKCALRDCAAVIRFLIGQASAGVMPAGTRPRRVRVQSLSAQDREQSVRVKGPQARDASAPGKTARSTVQT